MKTRDIRSRLFLSLLAALLLLSASCSIRHKYAGEARRWEKDMQKFDSLTAAERIPPGAVLFTGSSSIKLWSTIGEDVAPYPVIHRGFGGSKFSDLAVHIKRISDTLNYRI